MDKLSINGIEELKQPLTKAKKYSSTSSYLFIFWNKSKTNFVLKFDPAFAEASEGEAGASH